MKFKGWSRRTIKRKISLQRRAYFTRRDGSQRQGSADARAKVEEVAKQIAEANKPAPVAASDASPTWPGPIKSGLRGTIESTA